MAIWTCRLWSPLPNPTFLHNINAKLILHEFENNQMKIQRIRDKISNHFLQISGALRSVPSPLQGTSHKTRSNRSWPMFDSVSIPLSEALEKFLFFRQPGKCWASWFVTIKLAVHILFVWWIRRLHLWTSRSFAITYAWDLKVKN